MTISKLFDKILFFFLWSDRIPYDHVILSVNTVHGMGCEIHSNLLFKNCPCNQPCSWISSCMPNDSRRTPKSQWTYFNYVKIIFKNLSSRWIILKISFRHAIATFVYDYAFGHWCLKTVIYFRENFKIIKNQVNLLNTALSVKNSKI